MMKACHLVPHIQLLSVSERRFFLGFYLDYFTTFKELPKASASVISLVLFVSTQASKNMAGLKVCFLLKKRKTIFDFWN